MSKRVRRRRGTRAEHDEFTGADGEITVNTTDYRVHVHDGATAGGIVTAREDEVLHKDQNLSDVDSAATSRTNLGLGTAATKNANQNLRTTDDVTFKSVTTSQDNWTATAEPTVNDDNTAGYVVGSRWYYAGGSPHVQWVCVDASTGAADWVPVQERYESQTVELGGDFGTSQVHLLRRGDLVNITWDTLTHTSASTPQSDAVVPSAFLPTANALNAHFKTINSEVLTNGRFRLNRDTSGTSSPSGSITYSVGWPY